MTYPGCTGQAGGHIRDTTLRMFFHSFVFCCLGGVLFIAAADNMEILEERNILTEFMKYPLNNPKKDLDLQVLSLHLRPITREKSTRNGMDRAGPHRGQTIQLGGEIPDVVTPPAKPRASYKVPPTPKSKRRHKLEYEKLIEKYFRRKGRSKHRDRPRRPPKVRKPQVMQQKEQGAGYKEVKRKNLRSRRIDLFTRSSRKKEPKRKRLSVSRKVKPAHEELQTTELPGNWAEDQSIGNWVDIGHLALPPMIDGEVLHEENPLMYNRLGGENYYNSQQVDILQQKDEEKIHKQVTSERLRERLLLDQDRKLKSPESGGKGTTKEAILTEDQWENKYFHHFPHKHVEETSVMLLPTRNGVRDGEPPPDSQQLWRTADIPIIDIYSDTIQHAETHSGPYKDDDLQTQGDVLLQAEGSGSSYTTGLAQEDKMITSIPTKSSAQTPQETQEFVLSQPTAAIQPSSYSTSLSPTDRRYTEVPRVTEGEGSLDGILSPLEAAITHHPELIHCKPGYKEYGGVCRSQCEVGGINCGSYGQCVIVENIGAMCRCQQMNSLCYGGECCRSSLTTLQLAGVVGGCFILLSVFLGSLPFLIRRMDIKAISKSVRTSRLWISTLMRHSSTSLSSQSADLTVCSDYHSASDLSTLYRTKEVACNSAMWQCERTRL